MINKFSILNGAKYFSLIIFQNGLVFTPAIEYIKCFHTTFRIYPWKSNGMSEESIGNITKSDSSFAPAFVHHSSLNINFNGHCLIKTFLLLKKKSISKIYIFLTKLGPQLRNTNTDFTLSNCLFRSVELTNNADPDKCKYNGYGIGFDSHSEFPFIDGSVERSVIIFGADINSSVHVDNKGKDILILVEGPT